MKRIWNFRWKWAIILVPALLVPLIVIGLWPLNEEPLTREKYDKVQLGMTLDQVQKILGGPGRDLKDVNDLDDDAAMPTAPPFTRKIAEMAEEGRFEFRPDDNEPGKRFIWSDRDSGVMVRLGVDGRVTDKMFTKSAPMTFFQRVRYSIGF